MRKIRIPLSLAALLLASSAEAQSYMPGVIGATVGNMASDQAEMNCMQLKTSVKPSLPTKIQTAFQNYLKNGAKDALSARSYWRDSPDAGWMDLDGKVHPRGEHLFSGRDKKLPPLALEPVYLEVGHDLTSARGAWRLASSDGGEEQVYTVDFVGSSLGAWVLSQIKVTRTSSAPAQPSPYCHQAQLGSLW